MHEVLNSFETMIMAALMGFKWIAIALFFTAMFFKNLFIERIFLAFAALFFTIYSFMFNMLISATLGAIAIVVILISLIFETRSKKKKEPPSCGCS